MSVWSVKWKGFMRDFTCSILEFHNLQLSESHLCLMQTAEREWFLCVLSKCITLLAWGMLVWWGRLSAKSSLKRRKKKYPQKNVVKSFQSKYFSFVMSTFCTWTCRYYTNDTMLLIACYILHSRTHLMLHNSYQLKNLTLIASGYYSKLASGAVIHIIGLQISKGPKKKKTFWE